MSIRALQTIWKIQRFGCLKNNFCLPFPRRSYAIGHIRAPFRASTVFVCRKNAALLQHTEEIFRRTQSLATESENSPKKPVQIEDVLQSIDTYYKNNGSINYDSFCFILDLLEQDGKHSSQGLESRQTMFLLRACGDLIPTQKPDERMALFKRLWDYLASQKQLTAEHYSIALEVRIMNRISIADYRSFIEEARTNAPDCVNSAFYERLVRLACECGDLTQAKDILAEMRTNEYSLTEHVFNSLLIAHGRNGILEGLKTVLESMSAANFPQSIETQAMLVSAYIENKEINLATEILKEYQDQFDTEQIIRMLRATIDLSSKEAFDVVNLLIKELTKELIVSTEVPKPLRNFCIELIHARKQDQAVDILKLLPTPQFNENQDVDTFGAFSFTELFRASVPIPEIIDICEVLIRDGKNKRALHVATEICLRRNPPAVMPFFEAIAKKETLRPHYFWPLMLYNFRRWGETGIFRTLRVMNDFKVECDKETLTYQVLPRLTATMENPEQALKSFVECGVKTSRIITPVLAHMLSQNMLDQPCMVTQLYASKINCLELVQPLTVLASYVRSTKRYHHYAKLIQAIVKKSDNPKVDFVGHILLEIITRDTRLSSDFNALRRLVLEMQKFALKVSVAAAELIGSHLNKNFKRQDLSIIHKTLCEMSNHNLTLPNDTVNIGNNKPGSSSVTTHPRDMKREELECHLIELEAKGLNTRGALRRLLQLCVRDGKLERALEVKRKCEELKVNVSPGMIACIFEMYVKLKDTANADKAYKQLHQTFPDFQIDEHKIIDYASLLVEQQELETAKRILKDRAAKSKIEGGDYISKNVWNFLNKVAQMAAKLDLNKDQNLTKDTLEFLQQLGYCETQNAVFGPVVREFLLRNDLRSAVEEFARIAETYKRTPLQFELLSLLVRLSNQDEKNDNNASREESERFAIPASEAQSLLTSLTENITKAYGLQNMNTSLLLAFAESGTEQQLRRLMIDPNFCINEKLLMKNCDFLSEEGSLTTLLRLARSARGLHHINEKNIYDMILVKLKEKNNCDGALEFFERLEADDDLKISQDFINNLVSLLRINNVEIPSKLALRAKIVN